MKLGPVSCRQMMVQHFASSCVCVRPQYAPPHASAHAALHDFETSRSLMSSKASTGFSQESSIHSAASGRHCPHHALVTTTNIAALTPQRIGYPQPGQRHHDGRNPLRNDRGGHLLRYSLSRAQHGHACGGERALVFPGGVQHDHRAGPLGALAKGPRPRQPGTYFRNAFARVSATGTAQSPPVLS